MMNKWTINQNQFQEMINNGWIIIDVRSYKEVGYLRVLENSINIPYPGIIDNRDKLFPDKNAKLIMVCNAGNRSGMAAKAYYQNGYKNVFVLDCGIEGLNNY